ncbi:MAG: hypothetical protein AAB496_01035 [Patescibacteria group bacterium]
MKAKYRCQNPKCNAKWSIQKGDLKWGKCEKCGTPMDEDLGRKELILVGLK